MPTEPLIDAHLVGRSAVAPGGFGEDGRLHDPRVAIAPMPPVRAAREDTHGVGSTQGVRVNAVAQVFAVLAGLAHVGFFALESLLFGRPAIQRMFGTRPDGVAAARIWAFNQGFYNLFLAAGAIGGVITVHAGHTAVGRAIALYSCACMVGAGLVLLLASRRLWRGALAQIVLPLVALLAGLL
jgi:putative membrane protein